MPPGALCKPSVRVQQCVAPYTELATERAKSRLTRFEYRHRISRSRLVPSPSPLLGILQVATAVVYDWYLLVRSDVITIDMRDCTFVLYFVYTYRISAGMISYDKPVNVLTLLEPQSRSGDKPVKFQVGLSPNGTAVLKAVNASNKQQHHGSIIYEMVQYNTTS